MTEFTIKPLGPDTWDLFAGLAERHNGVWGRLLVHVVPSRRRQGV